MISQDKSEEESDYLSLMHQNIDVLARAIAGPEAGQ
jgi:ABC-type Zn uptake system ZnuABC Zn-binding protein ZnuA